MTEPATSEKRIHWKMPLLACCVILLLAAAGATVVFMTEPAATRSGATRETAMLVDVVEARRGTYRPEIVALGTVRPVRDVALSPQVSGEVVERAESFTPGGFVEEGEVLLRIDPSDYENTLQQRRSDLTQAEADLRIEMGQQDIARRDSGLLGGAVSSEYRDLRFREPQLATAQARVEAARAAVAQAERDLERTRIRAPFDARVLARNVNLGSRVSPGDDLGRLVGLDTYWVEASVPLSKLDWLSFADGMREGGAGVRLRNRAAWPEGRSRTGHLDRLVGALEDGTRLARVLISVPDPLARESGNSEVPRLMIGEFLEARIEGRELTEVVRLDRDYVRQGDTVWVMSDGQLRIRDVEIVLRDAENAYISRGLDDGDAVVTSNIATVVEGAGLRVASPAGAEEEAQAESSPNGAEGEPDADSEEAPGA